MPDRSQDLGINPDMPEREPAEDLLLHRIGQATRELALREVPRG